MLQTLAGRISWEESENGIRVEIRPRRDRTTVLRSLKASWASNWPMLIVLVPACLLISIVDRHAQRYFWWGNPLALLFGSMLGDVISTMVNRTILTLDAKTLKLEFHRWNRRRKQREFLTEHLHDLRFAKSTPRADIRNELRLNEIQFDRNFATQSFAPGITEDEATALIARMNEIYRFPKYPPS